MFVAARRLREGCGGGGNAVCRLAAGKAPALTNGKVASLPMRKPGIDRACAVKDTPVPVFPHPPRRRRALRGT
ncbi:ABC-type branched-chain amino acid transport systems, ATPase component [Methylobacterium aquaticum]|uniref:ABC-type branched-chain amino acid transport systems, ATPase component n=1 Tax=Methylobacterium aquaticum TaxID=270351 RepID=A0A0C6FIM0_9HYPH|nr:ABC-type branched-chain amino acid transport systems, ATPase component [Methylobacterium aquaticum]